MRGAHDDRHGDPALARGLPAGAVRVRAAVRLTHTRAAATTLLLDGRPDDVVEIDLQDGLRLWSRLEDVERDLASSSSPSRDAASGVVSIPPRLGVGPASRSIGGWAIAGLKLLDIDIESDIAGFVSQHVEDRLQPGPGLYLCSKDDPSRLTPPIPLAGKGPVLLFVHGTASSTAGSFGGLWGGSGAARTLFERYGGRVLAYQHRTLTVSPIENALDLVRLLRSLLGDGAELHLVSHSRGGLIGELIARGMGDGESPFTAGDLSLFGADRASDRLSLTALSRELAANRFRLTRFARVGCPARGTTLVDGRLDRYLSILVNLARLAGLQANPIYDGLTSLLAGVLKKRTDPRELPGLEAMMPASPLVRMLNRPDVLTSADLHVLGGDLDGTGPFGRLKTLVTDLYYRDDHDLVVNTPAMLGGVARSGPVRYWIDTGDQVTHFHYFTRGDTASRLVAALAGDDGGFRTLPPATPGVTAAAYIKRGTAARPAVIVLPGFMGSELTVEREPVWIDLPALARGGMSRLADATAEQVDAVALVAGGYRDLCQYLSDTHDVIPFPYDWRQPLAHSARALQRRLGQALTATEGANQPLSVVAHSTGGLVMRMMLATPEGADTWVRVCRHPDARFIMLGTPNGGSHAMASLLIGRDMMVRKLALVDLRNSFSGMLQTIASFDGLLDLLPPADDGGLDLNDAAVWSRLLDRGAPSAARLRRAKAVAARIRQSPLDPARVVYVAGSAPATACALVIDEPGHGDRRVRVLGSAHGDGRVLWRTGIPAGVPTFYMDAMHGDLASDRRHFPAILELVQRGTTTLLPATAPRRGGAATVFELPEPMPTMVPDEAELAADALGGRRTKMDTAEPQTKITVRVVHDNLTNAKSPVLVSHYKHDVIVAAEAYLDRRLDGRLRELHRMELYPGPLNTGVVVLNDTTPGDLSTHPGAVVAGLGIVGELTPGGLTSTLSHALTLYGADTVGRARRKQQRESTDGTITGGLVEAPLTAVLVGSGDGGLSVSDSIRAILTAVLQANQRLRGPQEKGADGAPKRLYAQIQSISIIELYEDRAIEALHLLRGLSLAPEFAAYDCAKLLVRGDAGIRRVRFDQSTAWWQRISVKDDPVTGAFEFTAVTQSARAPATLLALQRGHVEGFVQQARSSTVYDPRLGRTLFEMLVPNDFKPYAPDRQKLALMLTPETAALPWELLQDGFDRTAEPLSVASGMLRQLLVVDERQQVLRSPTNTALVIGNPYVSDERFPSLPGATNEAASVAGVLVDSGQWRVTQLLEEAASPEAVLSAIHERPWRILHLAGHGVFELDRGDGKARISGLVLDNGLFFTAADANQMRHVPELVFINCCHLGNTQGDSLTYIPFHKLAANLATQFIKMGARAVIAAGWAVNDEAARTFATSFYERLLQGDAYGDAILQARRNTYKAHGDTNTWGAYQCYGDPSFSVVAGQEPARILDFVSDSELRNWLEGVAARAREQEGDIPAALAALQAKLDDAPKEWWDGASDLCAAAGHAFFELQGFERALTYFEQAVDAERSTAPIRALEELANCRARYAYELSQAEQTRAEAAKLLARAESQVRGLLDFAGTSERWSLLGSVLKRKAMASCGRERAAALGEMAAAYAEAYARSKRSGAPDTYPLGNQIAAAIVGSWNGAASNGSAARESILSLVQEYKTLATARIAQHTDVFTLSSMANLLLLEALAKGVLDDDARQQIRRAFMAAFSRGVSAKARDSMRVQFEFFRTLMETEWPEATRAAMLANLKQLRDSLPL